VSFGLVIFDCDGVLVDSEEIACRMLAATLTKHGYPISADGVHDRFLGRSMQQMRGAVEAELGHSLPAEFGVGLRAEIDRAFETLQALPHIETALDAIAHPVCVASSGTPTRIRSSLTTVGLLGRFEHAMFSAAEVQNGKPAPDLFLHAAAQMNVPPARCLVIEDSIPGVTGAVAAGMTAFGFHGGGHCRPHTAASLLAAGAVAAFDDFRQLPAMIEQFLRVPA
jgi:HAD superfamily hydrolase (TIGR01509 family)